MVTASELEAVLVHTWNPDKATREGAEAMLGQFLLQPGSVAAMCTLIADATTKDRGVRQAAAILLKNNLRKFWVSKEFPTTEEEMSGTAYVPIECPRTP